MSLKNLEESGHKPIISNDTEAIGHFMADDWVIVGESGLTQKNQFLEFVASGDLTHETHLTSAIHSTMEGQNK